MLVLFAFCCTVFSQNVAKEDITLRDALRRLKGSFVLLGLKARRGLDRAFGPVLQPVWKVLGFALDVLYRLICAFIEAACEALTLTWNFLMQSIKKAFVWYRTRKLPKSLVKQPIEIDDDEPEQIEPEQVEPEQIEPEQVEPEQSEPEQSETVPEKVAEPAAENDDVSDRDYSEQEI